MNSSKQNELKPTPEGCTEHAWTILSEGDKNKTHILCHTAMMARADFLKKKVDAAKATKAFHIATERMTEAEAAVTIWLREMAQAWQDPPDEQ